MVDTVRWWKRNRAPADPEQTAERMCGPPQFRDELIVGVPDAIQLLFTLHRRLPAPNRSVVRAEAMEKPQRLLLNPAA